MFNINSSAGTVLNLAKKVRIVGVFLSLSACGTPETKTVLSPNKQFELKTELFDPGAMGTARFKVYVKQVNHQDTDPINVFDGNGGWPVSARWDGNGVIQIKSCGRTLYDATSEVRFQEGKVLVRVITDGDGFFDKFNCC